MFSRACTIVAPAGLPSASRAANRERTVVKVCNRHSPGRVFDWQCLEIGLQTFTTIQLTTELTTWASSRPASVNA
jgi:hypothetical protein